jgi:glutamate-1-semialdehyde 2,1-aminomutase
MVTYGKIIGAGLPVGAYAGRGEIMSVVSPDGPVYQAGTLSGNPLAMHAGYTLLNELNTNREIYRELEEKSALLADGLGTVLDDAGIPFAMNRVGSMLGLFFCEGPVTDFAGAMRTDADRFRNVLPRNAETRRVFAAIGL